MKTLILLLICTIALCNINLVSNTTEISPVEEPVATPAVPEETIPAPATPSDESDSSDDSSESSSDSSDDTSDSEFESSERPHGRHFPGRHGRRHHRRPHPQWHRRPHPRGPEGSEEFERPDFDESSEGDRQWRPHPRGHGRPEWKRRPDWHRRPHPGAPGPQFNGEELFEAPRGDFDGEPHWRPHHGHRRPHWRKRHHPRSSEEAGRPASEDSSDFVNLNDTEIEGPRDVDPQWRRPHHGPRRPHSRDEAPEAQSNGEQSFQAPPQEGQEFRPRPHWNRRPHPRDHHRRRQESQESEGSIPEQIAQPEVVAF